MMAAPDWAFYLESFITPPDDELVCSFCRNVFNNPIQTPCKHVFCKNCIHMWLQKSNECPLCRKRLSTNQLQDVVPLIKNLIANLKVRCFNFEKGCKDTFSLEKAQKHITNCVYETVKCKNEPCEFMAIKMSIETHETNECNFRRILCGGCGLSLAHEKVAHNCVDELKSALKEEKKKSKEFKAELQIYKDRYGSFAPAASGVKERGNKKRGFLGKDRCGSTKSASSGPSSFKNFYSPSTSIWSHLTRPPLPPFLANTMYKNLNHHQSSNELYSPYNAYSVKSLSHVNNFNEPSNFNQPINPASSINDLSSFNSYLDCFFDKLSQPSNPASNLNYSTLSNSEQPDNQSQSSSTASYSNHSTHIPNSNQSDCSSQKLTTASYPNQSDNLNQSSSTASYTNNSTQIINSNQPSSSNQQSTTTSDPNHSTFIANSNQPSNLEHQSTAASYLNDSAHINSNQSSSSSHATSDTIENNSGTVPFVVDVLDMDKPIDFIDLTHL